MKFFFIITTAIIRIFSHYYFQTKSGKALFIIKMYEGIRLKHLSISQKKLHQQILVVGSKTARENNTAQHRCQNTPEVLS